MPLDGDRDPRVLVTGPDFVSSPRLSPDGSRLAWLEWDHPDMPWDATRLRVAPIAADGTLGEPVLAAGGPDESIVQPEWAPDGTLHLVSDRSGWWNLYRLVDGPRLEPLAPMEAEFADPSWIFGRSAYGFLPDGSIVAVAPPRRPRPPVPHRARATSSARSRAASPSSRACRSVRAASSRSPAPRAAPTVVVRLDPETLAPAGVLRRSSSLTLDEDGISFPEPIDFPTSGGRTAHALFYPPRNPAFEGPPDERPPLRVFLARRADLERVHRPEPRRSSSGRAAGSRSSTSTTAAAPATAARSAASSTARGASSTSTTASRPRTRSSSAAPSTRRRMAISGGSAGGFTTLAALAFRDRFAAGISAFGVADLELLARETHKFESRYLDRLVGPYPEAVERYRSRSPIHAFDRIAVPVLVLQGLEDRVVVPAEAEAIVAALAANGIPYAYLAFEGEGHGFRGATAIRRSLEAELSFLAQVFGFEPADAIEPVTARRPRRVAGAPGRERDRPPPRTDPGARRWTPRPRSNSSCCCWSSRPGLAYLARRIGIAVPDRPRARRPRARARPRRGSATSRPIELPPDVVFLLFLPPILFGAGLRHADPRLQGEPARHRPARDRARAVHRRSSSRSSRTP